MRKHRDLADLYGEAPQAIAAAVEGFNKQVDVADQYLASKQYLVGEQFTGADIMLSSVLGWAAFYGIDLAANLREYNERTTARPAFAAAAKINFSITPED